MYNRYRAKQSQIILFLGPSGIVSCSYRFLRQGYTPTQRLETFIKIRKSDFHWPINRYE